MKMSSGITNSNWPTLRYVSLYSSSVETLVKHVYSDYNYITFMIHGDGVTVSIDNVPKSDINLRFLDIEGVFIR